MSGGVNWSEADLREYERRRVEAFNSLTGAQAQTMARGAPKLPRDRMNRTEAAYSAWLSVLKMMGRVQWFEFEGITLQLAPKTRYTPDFFVVTKDGIEMHETKGFYREAARVRLNVAAEKFKCFTFYLVRKKLVRDGGGWDVQRVGAPA